MLVLEDGGVGVVAVGVKSVKASIVPAVLGRRGG